MNRIFIRRRTLEEQSAGWRDPQQYNIGVTGLGRSVGTTFVASSLAFYFAEKGNCVTFSQCLTPTRCNGSLYDAAAMEQRFINRNFFDIYRMIFENKPVRGCRNREKNISWILPTSWSWENEADLNMQQRSRLIASARDELCIFDLAAEEEWDGFLMDMDRVIVVTDPMPSKLIRASGRFRMLKELELSGVPVCWLVNRVNSGVNRRQISGYLKNNRLIWLPELDSSLFYADEFACRFSWENEEIRCKILDIFTKVSQDLA